MYCALSVVFSVSVTNFTVRNGCDSTVNQRAWEVDHKWPCLEIMTCFTLEKLHWWSKVRKLMFRWRWFDSKQPLWDASLCLSKVNQTAAILCVFGCPHTPRGHPGALVIFERQGFPMVGLAFTMTPSFEIVFHSTESEILESIICCHSLWPCSNSLNFHERPFLSSPAKVFTPQGRNVCLNYLLQKKILGFTAYLGVRRYVHFFPGRMEFTACVASE